jgi:hypothetical protein
MLKGMDIPDMWDGFKQADVRGCEIADKLTRTCPLASFARSILSYEGLLDNCKLIDTTQNK